MKKNRLPVYVFIFLIAVTAFTMYGRTEIKEFPEGKTVSYQQSMQASITDILNKVPVKQIQAEQVLTQDQSAILVEKSERILSSFTELNAVAATYLSTDDSESKTQSSLENIYFSFSQLGGKKGSELKLTDRQADYITDVYQFLADVRKIDILDIGLDESLHEIEKVSEQYPGLERRMEGTE
ncbi:Uncharacterised protein [Bacillus freudenreichii]|nr:Uncharacterised protein [Bacillus freudenreichii]